MVSATADTRRKRLVDRLRQDSTINECYLCDSTRVLEFHHTSYLPEQTVRLCASCHNSVHAADSHELQPDRARPDNYQTVANRRWRLERRQDVQCDRCGDSKSLADLYLADPHPEYGTIQSKNLLDRVEILVQNPTFCTSCL